MKNPSIIKKISVLALVFSFLLSGCAITTHYYSAAEPADQQLVVLHTNDHHGSVLTRTDKDGIGHGGLAERATFIKQERAKAAQNGADILVLDAGDINTGTAVSNMFDAEPDILAYNAMGVDAVVFGNHEFDKSLAKLQKQMKMADFKWLSANIKNGSKTLGEPYIIKNFNGYKVGIFGLTTLRTLVIANPDASLTFCDEIETAQKIVDELKNKKKVDIVILLGHLGDVLETESQETSVKVAENVSGIDLIIDGHSHSFFESIKYVNDTPIVSANEQGKYMGKGVFTIKDKKITGFEWQPVEINDKDFPPDEKVAALLAPYVEKANSSLKEVVMQTTAEFDFGKKWPRYKEMASGDLLCDATVGYLKTTGVTVDFAIHNGGNIRTSLPKGDVTKENIVTMLPFENYVYVVDLPGTVVQELFDFIPTLNQGAGGFPQVSKEVNYTLTYDENGTHGKISNVTIGGKPIVPNKTYRVGTNDYMANGGDGYTAMTKRTAVYNASILTNDMFVDYVKTLPQPVTPATDGRIKVVGGAKLP